MRLVLFSCINNKVFGYMHQKMKLGTRSQIQEEAENRGDAQFSVIVGPITVSIFICDGVEYFIMGETHLAFQKDTLDLAWDVIRSNVDGSLVYTRGQDGRYVTISRFLFAWFLRTTRRTDFFNEINFDESFHRPETKPRQRYFFKPTDMLSRIESLFPECFTPDKRDCVFNENARVHFHATDFRGSPKSRMFHLAHFLSHVTSLARHEDDDDDGGCGFYCSLAFSAEFDMLINEIYHPFIMKYGLKWLKPLVKEHYLNDDFERTLLDYSHYLSVKHEHILELITTKFNEEHRTYLLAEYAAFETKVQEEARRHRGPGGMMKTYTTWTRARHQLKRLQRFETGRMLSQRLVEFIEKETKDPEFPFIGRHNDEKTDFYIEFINDDVIAEVVTSIMDIATLARMHYSAYAPSRMSKQILFYGGTFHSARYERYFKEMFDIKLVYEEGMMEKSGLTADMENMLYGIDSAYIMAKMNGTD